MKRLFAGLSAGLSAGLCAGICTMAFVSLIALQSPVQAQTAAGEAQTTETTKVAGPFGYDASREVTLSGTVSSVLAKPSKGMIMGSHLLLATPSGPVDASVGRFGLRGRGVRVNRGRRCAVSQSFGSRCSGLDLLGRNGGLGAVIVGGHALVSCDVLLSFRVSSNFSKSAR